MVESVSEWNSIYQIESNFQIEFNLNLSNPDMQLTEQTVQSFSKFMLEMHSLISILFL